MRNLLEYNSTTETSLPPTLDAKQATAIPSVFSEEQVLKPLDALFNYVKKRNYEGVDLFDGLNSRLFKPFPIYNSELFRLALIQFCKRMPINLRPLLLVPSGFNAKGGALFLMGNLNMLRHTGKELYANEAYILFQRLKHECISTERGKAWGYNFDWQARAFFVPQGTPNLVTSVYVGRAMLEYYQETHVPEALELALGVSHFLLNDMVHYEDINFLCFNYIPGRDAEVHNANLLGAAYLAQTLAYLPEPQQQVVREKILKSVRFSTLDVSADGSWPYGTKPFHRWVDNFHTAYNIECLMHIGHYLETDEFVPVLKQVVDYYLAHLFTADGLPKYYNSRLYPIDIHVIAETMVLFQCMRRYGMAWDNARMTQIETQLLQLIEQFQHDSGYFYYQKLARSWNRIPYIRWGQAWMFYALSSCL
jgi:hypothetical protein